MPMVLIEFGRTLECSFRDDDVIIVRHRMVDNMI